MIDISVVSQRHGYAKEVRPPGKRLRQLKNQGAWYLRTAGLDSFCENQACRSLEMGEHRRRRGAVWHVHAETRQPSCAWCAFKNDKGASHNGWHGSFFSAPFLSQRRGV